MTMVCNDGTESHNSVGLKTVRRCVREVREVAQTEPEFRDAAGGRLPTATPRSAPVPIPLSLCPVAALTALLSGGSLSAAEGPEHRPGRIPRDQVSSEGPGKERAR